MKVPPLQEIGEIAEVPQIQIQEVPQIQVQEVVGYVRGRRFRNLCVMCRLSRYRFRQGSSSCRRSRR